MREIRTDAAPPARPPPPQGRRGAARGHPRCGARAVLGPRAARGQRRGHRRAGRALEDQPALLLPLEGGALRRGAAPGADGLARSAPGLRRRQRTGRGVPGLHPRQAHPVAGRAPGLAAVLPGDRPGRPPAARRSSRAPCATSSRPRPRSSGAGARTGGSAAHDPHHLIFSIWAITQHYADFAVQVEAVTGRGLDDPDFFERTVASTQALILAGLGLR